MDALMLLNKEEEEKLIQGKDTLNNLEARQLTILKCKLALKYQFLQFEWPPRTETEAESLRFKRLETATEGINHVPVLASEALGYWKSAELSAARELLNDCITISREQADILGRDQRYSLLMCRKYLVLMFQPFSNLYIQVLLDAEVIRAQQDALAVELSGRDTESPRTARILGIVDLITYNRIPLAVKKGEQEGCSICYEELEDGVPKGADVRVVRQTKASAVFTSYIINGTSSRLTHHTAMLPCGHSFGSRCIWTHLLTSQACPYCRMDFTIILGKYIV